MGYLTSLLPTPRPIVCSPQSSESAHWSVSQMLCSGLPSGCSSAPCRTTLGFARPHLQLLSLSDSCPITPASLLGLTPAKTLFSFHRLDSCSLEPSSFKKYPFQGLHIIAGAILPLPPSPASSLCAHLESSASLPTALWHRSRKRDSHRTGCRWHPLYLYAVWRPPFPLLHHSYPPLTQGTPCSGCYLSPHSTVSSGRVGTPIAFIAVASLPRPMPGTSYIKWMNKSQGSRNKVIFLLFCQWLYVLYYF